MFCNKAELEPLAQQPYIEISERVDTTLKKHEPHKNNKSNKNNNNELYLTFVIFPTPVVSLPLFCLSFFTLSFFSSNIPCSVLSFHPSTTDSRKRWITTGPANESLWGVTLWLRDQIVCGNAGVSDWLHWSHLNSGGNVYNLDQQECRNEAARMRCFARFLLDFKS